MTKGALARKLTRFVLDQVSELGVKGFGVSTDVKGDYLVIRVGPLTEGEKEISEDESDWDRLKRFGGE